MAVNKITIGLAAIELGAIAVDGGMGTTLTPWGYTEQDSCTITISEPELTEFIPEEIDDAIYIASKDGEKTIAFTIMDAGTDTLVNLFGGTVTTTGTAPNEVKTFSFPSSNANVEKSVRIIPKEGLITEITRAKVTASMDSTYSKNGLFTVKVSLKVLKPKKVGESSLRVIDDPTAFA